MSTALWLSISTTAPVTPADAAAGAIEALRQSAPELFAAPELEPWPPDMPAALDSPNQVLCWTYPDHEPLGLGSFVPRRLDRATHHRLLVLERYPFKCQARIDALVPKVVTAIADQAAADAVPDGYSLQTVAIFTVGGIAVGALLTAAIALAVN